MGIYLDLKQTQMQDNTKKTIMMVTYISYFISCELLHLHWHQVLCFLCIFFFICVIQKTTRGKHGANGSLLREEGGKNGTQHACWHSKAKNSIYIHREPRRRYPLCPSMYPFRINKACIISLEASQGQQGVLVAKIGCSLFPNLVSFVWNAS